MSISTHGPNQLCWTALGQRMGFTSEHAQREEILAAIDRVNWIDTPTRPAYLDSQAVRAVVMAVLHRRRDQLRLVGSAHLSGGRQLIGLEDTLGTRSYVLDLDAEAIYVLAEFGHPLGAAAGRHTNHAVNHHAPESTDPINQIAELRGEERTYRGLQTPVGREQQMLELAFGQAG